MLPKCPNESGTICLWDVYYSCSVLLSKKHWTFVLWAASGIFRVYLQSFVHKAAAVGETAVLLLPTAFDIRRCPRVFPLAWTTEHHICGRGEKGLLISHSFIPSLCSLSQLCRGNSLIALRRWQPFVKQSFWSYHDFRLQGQTGENPHINST